MKHSLQLRLSQHLTLTPQLQQSIRLLQLSTLELNQKWSDLQENPLPSGKRERQSNPSYGANGTETEKADRMSLGTADGSKGPTTKTLQILQETSTAMARAKTAR